MKRGTRVLQNGFTLIELMVTVAIVGILTAVALPAYGDYVTRSRLTEAFTALAGAQPSAEQFWSNNRNYQNFDTTVGSGFPTGTANFTYALSGATTSTYTITANGIGKMTGFSFSIAQDGTRSTLGVPQGWTAPNPNTCWTNNKGGACLQ
jgi:type IV pilus assembly protein PilE